MTTEETIEGNRLIAEFMGEKMSEDKTLIKAGRGHGRYYHGMYYHSDWNSLMKVCQKILKTDTGTLDVYSLYVCDALSTADIKQVWLTVVEFIKWYNKNK